MEAAFPNEDEVEVASALLLLSSTPSPPSLPKMKIVAELSYTTPVMNSKSKSNTCNNSTITTNDDEAKAKAKARRVKMIRMFRIISKLKAVRKRRSKILCKPKTAPSVSASASASALSCVTNDSSSTEITSRLSREQASKVSRKHRENRSPRIGSAHMRRRAEAIMKVLSTHGCGASEVRIRELLGNSPDTSKALRILLRLEQVKRIGAGGRTDPFVYLVNLPYNKIN